MKLFFLSTCFIAITTMLGLAIVANGQNTSVLTSEGDLNCKWWTEYCPDGTNREICLTDGTGHACECGDTTRACE